LNLFILNLTKIFNFQKAKIKKNILK